ncbi:MAG TPA: hypothetical protein VL128_01560 [Candidatus Eisenbacteria bacterium]|nr:hypothetical protein [Candidatus Eisenbacteria bacterium]
MFYWGAGSTLGLLTCLGYFVFFLGCLYLWRHREDLSLWVEDEFSAFRRNLSRFESVGPFYLPRTESRLRVIPAGFLSSVSRFPHRRLSLGAFLLFLGLILFALDFFI